MQKGVGTPFSPHYTPGDKMVLVSLQNSETVCHPCLSIMLSCLVFSHHWLLSLLLAAPLKYFCTHHSVGPAKVFPIGPCTC